MIYEKLIKDYLREGLLKNQKTDLVTVEKLIIRAHKDLKAAQANIDIDEEIAFTIAYLAMLHAGRAFISLKGFRPSGRQQHKTVVEFMHCIFDKKYKVIIEHFDRMRRKRNIFTYEVDISISKTEAVNSIKSAVEFVKLIEEAIKKENPQFKLQF